MIILPFLMMLFLAFPALAQDAEPKPETPQETGIRHAPPGCDFEVTFPEAPARARRCPGGQPAGSQQTAGSKCYDVTSYTKVYDLSTTVDVSVTCTPSSPAALQRYGEPVMRAALEGMVARKTVRDYEISVRDVDKTIRQASLTGTGTTGRQEKIYTAQIWVGPASLMTVQAELIGAAHGEADTAFGQILESIQPKKEDPAPPKTPDEKEPEKE